MNPGVLLNGDSRVYLPDAQHILPPDLFQLHPLLSQSGGGLPEQPEILAYESVGDVQICLIGEFQEGSRILVIMRAEEAEALVLVFG